MKDYSARNVLELLNKRQLGLPLKGKGRAVRHKRNNYRCDFEILKSLLCDHQSYLEVIACRRVSRSAEPSFCHGRLFTCNYHSWFNLCTSPSSGPRLMKTNVFSDRDQSNNGNQLNPTADGVKVIDAVTLNPPNSCSPLPNSQHLPCIFLLTRSGWLYQFNLECANLLNKVYVPTSIFVDKLIDCENSRKCNHDSTPSSRSSHHKIEQLPFKYQYITINGTGDKVLLRSAILTDSGYCFVAYALYGVFPLRFIDHFISVASSSLKKVEIWNDILIVTSVKGSSISLYSFQDIKKLHHISAPPLKLNSISFVTDLLGRQHAVTVGQSDVGFPYTMSPVDLDKTEEWTHLELFRTKAERHIFRIGGIPFHYIVPTTKSCTTWSLRNLADKREVSRFHVDEKWDGTHLSSFDFHSDESGRIVLINKGIITVYALKQQSVNPYTCSGNTRNLAVCEECSNKEKSKKMRKSYICPNETCVFSKKRKSRSRAKTNLMETYPIAQSDYHLRVIGSICTKIPLDEITRKCRVLKCFEIDISYQSQWERARADDDAPDGDVPNWRYPSSVNKQGNMSSSGRVLRKTKHFGVGDAVAVENTELDVLGVSYEDELDVLAVLHYKKYPQMDPHQHDLVVSLYDNATGAKMNSMTIECDIAPTDENEVSVILDEDTVIYTKIETNDVLDYKIMRLCRRT